MSAAGLDDGKTGPGAFDPWTATFDEARATDEAGRPSYATPVQQWLAAQSVLRREVEVKAGDGMAVMHCISQCVWHELVAPHWLAVAFLHHYRLVAHLRVKSWDKALGPPFKGRHFGQLRQHRDQVETAAKVASEAIYADPGQSLTGVYDAITRACAVDVKGAERLYRIAVKRGLLMSIQEVRLARGMPNYPKNRSKNLR